MTTKKHSQTELHGEILTDEQAYQCAMSAYTEKLDLDQECQLVEHARGGGQPERDHLLLYLYPYLKYFAQRYVGFRCLYGVDFMDLAHDGYIAILSSIDRVLAHETDQVIAHLLRIGFNCIRNKAIQSRSSIKTPYDVEAFHILSLDVPFSDLDDGTLADLIEDLHFCGEAITQDSSSGFTPHPYEPLHHAIHMLSDRQREVIVRVFGLYCNPVEPLSDIAGSLGIVNGCQFLTQILTKLCLVLKDAYPHYCSPTREVRQVSTVTYKPLTPEQEQRLQAAEARLREKNMRVTVRNLRREAHIDDHVAGLYLRRFESSQEERLSCAIKEMQSRGEKISGRALAKVAHVDAYAVRLFLHMQEPELVSA
jgi:hypothetical protein